MITAISTAFAGILCRRRGDCAAQLFDNAMAPVRWQFLGSCAVSCIPPVRRNQPIPSPRDQSTAFQRAAPRARPRAAAADPRRGGARRRAGAGLDLGRRNGRAGVHEHDDEHALHRLQPLQLVLLVPPVLLVLRRRVQRPQRVRRIHRRAVHAVDGDAVRRLAGRHQHASERHLLRDLRDAASTCSTAAVRSSRSRSPRAARGSSRARTPARRSTSRSRSSRASPSRAPRPTRTRRRWRCPASTAIRSRRPGPPSTRASRRTSIRRAPAAA